MSDWFKNMRRGDFAAAWAISDAMLRTHVPDWTAPRHEQLIWNGSPLHHKRVLIRCYHGLGDTIQFARFIPMVEAIARETYVWVQPSLIPLLRTLRTRATFLPLHDGAPDVDYDVDVELMELAHVFRVTIDTIPRPPYLHVDAAREGGIGVVWRAGDWDVARSIPFDLLAPLLATAPLVSLQRDPGVTHARLHIIDGVDDPLSTARVMRSLDLVITVDTMTAHLAGALDVPVFTLLPHACDWRWMDARDDSPWYPSMRLFRQARPDDWSEVLERVRYAVAMSEEPKSEEPKSEEPKKESLNDWGIDVDKFKERAKESLAGAKDDLTEIAGTLRQTLVQAKDVLLGLQKGGAPAASELKTGFERAWHEIENAFKAARDRAKEARAESTEASTSAADSSTTESTTSDAATGETQHNVPPSDDAMSP